MGMSRYTFSFMTILVISTEKIQSNRKVVVILFDQNLFRVCWPRNEAIH